MNRLTDIYLSNTHSQIVYDPLGRMTSKQADGQIVFANADFSGLPGQPARPHAMKSAENQYDRNSLITIPVNTNDCEIIDSYIKP